MPRALILGGTGAIGRATAHRLLAAGWQVGVTGRNPALMPADLADAGVTFLAADRADAPDVLVRAGGGVDLLVDCACFTGADATRLLPLARAAGSTVMISSKAVYVDAVGNHSNSEEPPRFDGPIPESQPTLPPGNGDYTTREGYGTNKVAAERVLLDSGLPVTVLRPSKVHGPGSRRPREWVFVKRALDRRRAVFLARRGAGTDHPTAAANVAALVALAVARPAARVLNAADPDAPSALDIVRTVARLLDHDWREVLLPGDAEGAVGRHPWDAPYPIVLDTSAAVALGFRPAGDYAATVVAEVEWLVAAASGGPDKVLVPRPDDEFFGGFFDYAAEDRLLAAD